MLKLTIHVDLAVHIEFDILVLDKLFDLSIGARLLGELIGREGGNAQPLVLVLGVQFVHLTVVDVREGAVRGHIDHEQNFAIVLVKGHIVAIDVQCGEGVNVGRVGGLSQCTEQCAKGDDNLNFHFSVVHSELF